MTLVAFGHYKIVLVTYLLTYLRPRFQVRCVRYVGWKPRFSLAVLSRTWRLKQPTRVHSYAQFESVCRSMADREALNFVEQMQRHGRDLTGVVNAVVCYR